MNTNNTTDNNSSPTDPKVRISRFLHNVVQGSAVAIGFVAKALCICAIALLLIIVGSYYGVSLYNVEKECKQAELYPMTSEQIDQATTLIESTARYMDYIEFTNYGTEERLERTCRNKAKELGLGEREAQEMIQALKKMLYR